MNQCVQVTCLCHIGHYTNRFRTNEKWEIYPSLTKGKNSELPPLMGSECPVKWYGGGGGGGGHFAATQPACILFNGKSTKGFSCFSEQMRAKFCTVCYIF